MSLSYPDFKNKVDAEKNKALILLESSIDEVDPKETKQFLGDLFNDSTQDFYLRKRALQLGGYLTLLKKIKPEWVIAIVVDIDEKENEFVVIAALQLGSQLIHVSNDSIISWAETRALDSNNEVRSEAFLLLGKNYFFEALNSTSLIAFIQTIEKAVNFFGKSKGEIENRVDALLFHQISLFLSNIKTGKHQEIDSLYKEIKENLWTYTHFNTKIDNNIFFESLCYPLSVLHRLSVIDPENWLDFKAELFKIFIEVQKLEIRSTTENQLLTKNIDNYSLALKEKVIYEFLGDKLRNDLGRLYRLKEECVLETPSQIELLNDLLEAVTNEVSKKKELTDLTIAVARLHGAFPEIPIEEIQTKVNSIKSFDLHEVLALVEVYAKKYSGIKTTEFETGTPQGDEIHQRVVNELQNKLVDYPLEKTLNFRLILRDVVNYFIRSTRASKSAFPFLFKNDAVEKDLQNSLMLHFSISNRASNYTPEVTEAADGGRVDVLFTSNSLQLPIELKRSLKPLNWEKIEQDYISQAQTYAHTRDQLAFFLVMDVSPQEPTKPTANVRDLFKVIHLKAKHDLDNHFPDHVICFIIPGNKVDPHDRSKY